MLNQFQNLKDAGFSSEHIECALLIYPGSPEKAKQYLTAFIPLVEMGFSPDSVKTALLDKNLDREAALESLIGNT